MWALLVNLWALGTAAFRSLVGANTESRADFVAITNALQVELQRQAGQLATEVDRRERMQAKIDAMHDVVEQLRQENGELRQQMGELREENTDLRRQLADCNRRHVEEEAKNRMLSDRVAFLESREREATRKSSPLGGGI